MGSNCSTPVVEGVDNRPILSMGGRMCTWYQSAHPARLCRPIGSVPWLCCYPSAVVVMLERDVAIGLNANRWRHLTLFIQIHGTHCVGKCITPPLKKCFHHCSGITLNVIHPFDQDRTRYLTWSAICCSVGWRDLSRNACIRSCIVSRSWLLIIDSTFICWKWCIFWRKTEFTVSFLKAYLLPSPFALLSLLTPWRRYVLAPCVWLLRCG